MKSLILIPFYLWRNTFKRWSENLSSPVSKIIIPYLLSTLSILVLVFYSELERHLEERLRQSSAYHVRVNENVSPQNGTLLAELANEEEAMWARSHKEGEVVTFWQLYLTAQRKSSSTPTSIIVYNNSFEKLSLYDKEFEAPTIWYLTSQSHNTPSKVEVEIGEQSVIAHTTDIPDTIKKHLKAERAIALPFVIAKKLMRNGFLTHISADFSNRDETFNFVEQVEAFHLAEKRRVDIISSVNLLQELAKVEQIQQYIRYGITIMSGIILSLTLGSIALLEFRQESYLLALLRSFGVSRTTLLIHSLLENSILVSIGIYSALQFWPSLYNSIRSQLVEFPLTKLQSIHINPDDTTTILLSGVVGVALAMIPVALGLRKPAGLILQ